MMDERQKINEHLADPSALTLAQIFREIGSLKELFESKFEGYDKAIVLLQDIANRSPSIQEVYLQHEEKFKSIEKQFIERDLRVEQTARDTKTAVDAALQAQKESAAKQAESFSEATRKSEEQFTKQIDQQRELLRTEVTGIVTQHNELKDRLNRGEGRGEGVATYRTDHRAMSGNVIAIIAIAAAFIIGAAVITAGILSR